MSKKIRDIMTRNVEIVRPDETLQEAAMKMRSRDVGFLPVCDGQRLVGALSDRDIAIGSVAEGKDPKKMKVRDLASSTVCWCYDDQDVDDAASMMTDKGVRRIMVVERNGKQLVGVVSLGDLATKSSGRISGSILEKMGPK